MDAWIRHSGACANGDDWVREACTSFAASHPDSNGNPDACADPHADSRFGAQAFAHSHALQWARFGVGCYHASQR
jgi:hypothetical protein